MKNETFINPKSIFVFMADEESSTITTTIEVDKETFLKFKALCVLKELKISAEIEKLIKRWIDDADKGR